MKHYIVNYAVLKNGKVSNLSAAVETTSEQDAENFVVSYLSDKVFYIKNIYRIGI